MALRTLGKTDIAITSIGLGCWQFSEGAGPGGNYWPPLPRELTNEIVAASLAGGINWFDTAEAYGFGRSERGLALALTAAGKKPGEVVVATKWFPLLRIAASLEVTARDRLEALAPFGIDLHQVHQPIGLSSVEAEMGVMADLVAAKKIRSAGVSNFNAQRMRRAHGALKARGLCLASNQVKYSLLDRRIEKNGVLAAAKELGVTIIAYSPLEQGLLSGKFHDDPGLLKSIPGLRKWVPAFREDGLAKSQPLIDALKQIAAAHGVTPSQVALSWLVNFHGETVVAIPGATKARHVVENVGAMSVKLSALEFSRLDELSRPL
jgi:aryl-alcohol dehydrogenase-like predicted oxidoreductase